MRKCQEPNHERVIYKSGRSCCITCRRIKTPKRSKEYYQQRYIRDKAKPGFREKQRANHRRMKYGFSGEVIGKCQICLERPATDVDHCHKTGKVRGFLCRRCNVWLGVHENTIFNQQASDYLKRSS